MRTKAGDSITRNGTADTVWREGEACLWMRNQGEQLIISINKDFSDEELLESIGAYLRWRRKNPVPPPCDVV